MEVGAHDGSIEYLGIASAVLPGAGRPGSGTVGWGRQLRSLRKIW